MYILCREYMYICECTLAQDIKNILSEKVDGI